MPDTAVPGFYPNGRPGEAFTGNAKVGSAMDGLLDDACILVSLLLQNGVGPAALAKTVGRLEDGKEPVSVIGAIVDLLAERQAATPDERLSGSPIGQVQS